MAKTRQTHPSLDNGKVSRRERYQLRSKLPIVNTATTPPHATKDVSSPLSTASVAAHSKTSTAITIPTLPPMQRYGELSPTPPDDNNPCVKNVNNVDVDVDDDDDNNNNDVDNAEDNNNNNHDYNGVDD
jgi:hypothetical protein